ncbi:hypothetical protein DB30_04772 [Enhygromyxa salina]|uniref:Uncharacterized protein n=1 Tax=Enhygromyxa salina TaxID=215803 RepID=A0A0C2D8L8_9BACT|nr:hypothetical protein DB30_04772 [Enhygromyxa salina]
MWAGGLHDRDLPVPAVVNQDTLEHARAFDGDFVFDGGQKQRDGVTAAIETSVAALNPMVRKLGRQRLQQSNPILKNLSIRVDDESVAILFDGDGHRAKLDGTPHKTESAHGDKVKVSHRMRGTKLVELLDGVGGDRHNEFKLSADGSRLTIKVKIISSQLPVPVEYDLTYKRK